MPAVADSAEIRKIDGGGDRHFGRSPARRGHGRVASPRTGAKDGPMPSEQAPRGLPPAPARVLAPGAARARRGGTARAGTRVSAAPAVRRLGRRPYPATASPAAHRRWGRRVGGGTAAAADTAAGRPVAGRRQSVSGGRPAPAHPGPAGPDLSSSSSAARRRPSAVVVRSRAPRRRRRQPRRLSSAISSSGCAVCVTRHLASAGSPHTCPVRVLPAHARSAILPRLAGAALGRACPAAPSR